MSGQAEEQQSFGAGGMGVAFSITFDWQRQVTAPSRSDIVDAKAHVSRGHELYGLGRPAEAEAAYRQAIKLRPDDPEAHNGLGATLAVLGRPAEAEAAFRQTITLRPDDPQAHNDLGLTLAALRRHGEAEAAFRQAITLRPDFPETHCNLGLALEKQGLHAEAEAPYLQAIALQLDYPEAHFNLGVTLAALGRQAEAEVAYRQAITLRPDDPQAHNNLGNTLAALRRYAEAEAAYRQAIKLRPDFPEAHFNLGLTLAALGRQAEAEAAYRQAILLRPDDPGAHNGLGGTLWNQGRHAEAEAAIRQAIKLRPNDPQGHANLGITLQDQGRSAEAEAALRQAIKLQRDYPQAHNRLDNTLLVLGRHAQTLAALGRFAEAEAALRQAIKLRPDDPGEHYNLGITLTALDRQAEAETAYREAIKLRREYPQAHFNLGLLLTERSRFVEALGSFGAAVRFAPEDPRFSGDFVSCLETVSRYRDDASLLLALQQARVLDLMLDFGTGAFLMQAWRAGPRALPMVMREGRMWGLPGAGLVRDLLRRVIGDVRSARGDPTTGQLERHRLLAAARDELMWTATEPSERRQWLEQFAGLGADAAAAFLAAGQPEQAAEHLERGLAVQLGLEAGLNFADLARVRQAGRADLAERYETALANRNARWRMPDKGQERWLGLRAARVELDAAVAGIRSVDPQFGAPMDWPRIAAVSAQVPLVYLASVRGRLLAVLVQDGKAEAVRGVGADAAAVDAPLQTLATSYATVGSRAERAWQQDFETALGALWDPLVGPVVMALQRRGIGRAALVAAGPLARVPLHLAWQERRGRRRYAMDEVELRQVPSARLLEGALGLPVAEGGTVLAILDDRQSGVEVSLAKQAEAAAGHLAGLFGDRLVALRGAGATREAVLAALRTAQVVYFLGHGRGARGAAEESVLHLASGEVLRLGDVTSLQLAGQLWVVVACEGARASDDQPDEARAFPAGLLSARAAGVISAPCVVDALHAVPVSLATMAGLAQGQHPAGALRAAQQAQATGRLTVIGTVSANLFGTMSTSLPATNDPGNPAHWAFQYAGA